MKQDLESLEFLFFILYLQYVLATWLNIIDEMKQ